MSAAPAVSAAARPDDFLRAAAAWVALLLERQIARARAGGLLPALAAAGDPLAGRYIGDPELDRAARSVAAEQADVRALDDPAGASRAIRAAAEGLSLRMTAAVAADVPLPFQVVASRFQLTSDEQMLLLVLVVAALDPRVRRMVAYLQNHMARTRLDAGIALALLRDDPEAGRLPWELLHPDGALRVHALVHVDDDAHGRSLAERALSVPDGIVGFIARGATWLDDEVATFARVETPAVSWDELVWADAERARLRQRIDQASHRVALTGESGGLLLRGPAGAGKKTAVRATCRALRRPLLVVDALRIPPAAPVAVRCLRGALRDARLHDAVVYLEHAEALGADGGATLMALTHLLQRGGQLVFLGSEREDRIAAEEALGLASVRMPRLEVGERQQLWRSTLPAALDPGGLAARRLAERYPLGPGDIVPVGADAAAAARARGGAILDERELDRLVFERSRHNLSSIATPVRTRLTLDDVVLPPDVVERCKRIVQMVESQGTLA
ncbi:MAG TPA: hypothetical protein VHE35_12245, partial [Kofleriaceae bacterium]|nr:hypothetical protein [Kofleriaceae bacterium]